MYIVQLYEEDWTILHMVGCQAVALPSIELIVESWAVREFWERSGKFSKMFEEVCVIFRLTPMLRR